MKFSSTTNGNVWKIYSTPRINKMVKKHSVDQHPSPSGFNSQGYNFSYSYKILRVLSLFWIFFLKSVIPLWVGEIFKLLFFRLLENAFESHKIDSGKLISNKWPILPHLILEDQLCSEYTQKKFKCLYVFFVFTLICLNPIRSLLIISNP